MCDGFDATAVALHALLVRHRAFVLALLLVALEDALRSRRRSTHLVELLVADAPAVRPAEAWAALAAAAGALTRGGRSSAGDQQEGSGQNAARPHLRGRFTLAGQPHRT